MNILESNELISEFMGFIPEEFEKRASKGLQYHISWDWLMPVVEKIETLRFGSYCVNITKLGTKISTVESVRSPYKFNLDVFKGVSHKEKKQATFEVAVKFIEWFNNK